VGRERVYGGDDEENDKLWVSICGVLGVDKA